MIAMHNAVLRMKDFFTDFSSFLVFCASPDFRLGDAEAISHPTASNSHIGTTLPFSHKAFCKN
jgi:hypothetical protein